MTSSSERKSSGCHSHDSGGLASPAIASSAVLPWATEAAWFWAFSSSRVGDDCPPGLDGSELLPREAEWVPCEGPLCG